MSSPVGLVPDKRYVLTELINSRIVAQWKPPRPPSYDETSLGSNLPREPACPTPRAIARSTSETAAALVAHEVSLATDIFVLHYAHFYLMSVAHSRGSSH